MKSHKNEILMLYFEEKLKQVDISNKLKISKNAVSKTIKKDSRYEMEKENRKLQNKMKHNKDIQRRVEMKRKSKGISDIQLLNIIHIQASLELSDNKKTMSNKAFRDWNSSIYCYDKKRQSYILKRGIVSGADVPKKIKWTTF